MIAQADVSKFDPHNCVQVSENKDLNDYALNMKSLYEQKNYSALLDLTKEIIRKYAQSAQEMQASLSKYPKRKPALSMGELNLVSLAFYWQAIANHELNQPEKAQYSTQKLTEVYYYGQCLTEKRVIIKPVEALKTQGNK